MSTTHRCLQIDETNTKLFDQTEKEKELNNKLSTFTSNDSYFPGNEFE